MTPGALTGMNVLATLPNGAARPGVGIPPSAVIWQAGKAWIYVRAGSDRFERRAIGDDAAPTADGGYVLPATSLQHDRLICRGRRANAIVGGIESAEFHRTRIAIDRRRRFRTSAHRAPDRDCRDGDQVSSDRRRFEPAASGLWRPVGHPGEIRRLPRIRAAPGRHPDRGAGPRGGGNRSSRHATARERDQRRFRHPDAALVVDPGTIRRQCDLRSGQRHLPRSSGRRRAPRLCLATASRRREATRPDAAHLVEQHRPRRRPDVENKEPHGPADRG